MKTIIYVFIFLSVLPVKMLGAAGKCTAAKLAITQGNVAAVMKSDKPKCPDSWEKLRLAFEGNRDCMAVFEAYDFGEAARHLMQNHWDKIGSLEKYKNEDNAFFLFVMSGLKDETANIEDIKAIHSMAEKKCPSGAESLCQEIAVNTLRTR